MKEKLTKLLDVKSLITILLSGVFAYLSISGVISGEEFLTIFTVIISFYFGTQTNKDKVNNVAAAEVEGEKENKDKVNYVAAAAEVEGEKENE